jgi:phosphoribosylformylglycinamidine synthase PurS subunit
MKYEVRVQLKPDVLNVEAKEIHSAIHSAGFSSVVGLHTSKLFILEIKDGSNHKDTIHKIADEILSNNIIEDFSITKIDV